MSQWTEATPRQSVMKECLQCTSVKRTVYSSSHSYNGTLIQHCPISAVCANKWPCLIPPNDVVVVVVVFGVHCHHQYHHYDRRISDRRLTPSDEEAPDNFTTTTSTTSTHFPFTFICPSSYLNCTKERKTSDQHHPPRSIGSVHFHTWPLSHCHRKQPEQCFHCSIAQLIGRQFPSFCRRCHRYNLTAFLFPPLSC